MRIKHTHRHSVNVICLCPSFIRAFIVSFNLQTLIECLLCDCPLEGVRDIMKTKLPPSKKKKNNQNPEPLILTLYGYHTGRRDRN